MKKQQIIITCEHGGNEVPQEYAELFAGHEELLQSHRGWDPGALKLAKFFAKELEAPLFYSTTTRLLIELNRSLRRKGIFSIITKNLPPQEKKKIIEEYYLPYRAQVEKAIVEKISQGFTVVHISVHSFTPELNGELRNADVGLLFDPSRKEEKQYCRQWKQNLQQQDPKLRVRYNYPYLGKADGFCTWLRKKLPSESYLGVELEVNQGMVKGDFTGNFNTLSTQLISVLKNICACN